MAATWANYSGNIIFFSSGKYILESSLTFLDFLYITWLPHILVILCDEQNGMSPLAGPVRLTLHRDFVHTVKFKNVETTLSTGVQSSHKTVISADSCRLWLERVTVRTPLIPAGFKVEKRHNLRDAGGLKLEEAQNRLAFRASGKAWSPENICFYAQWDPPWTLICHLSFF